MTKKLVSKLDFKGQLELGVERKKEADRNFHMGGRSFYFFDFDDNVVTLNTPIVLFKKREAPKKLPLEVFVSSRDFAIHSSHIGKSGPYEHYHVIYDDRVGSFKYFRDVDLSEVEKIAGKKQKFIYDFAEAIGGPDFHWKGPSWSCFYHAVFNGRPISLITARGHHPETLKKGIQLLVDREILPQEPNYLSLYPVNHPETRKQLGHSMTDPVPVLKKSAIRASVEEAIKTYGDSPYHRFGMSDDDPKNIELIIEEMIELKKDFQEMSFFVIDTFRGRFIKKEIFVDHIEDHEFPFSEQLTML